MLLRVVHIERSAPLFSSFWGRPAFSAPLGHSGAFLNTLLFVLPEQVGWPEVLITERGSTFS